jgi:hypothetical protein
MQSPNSLAFLTIDGAVRLHGRDGRDDRDLRHDAVDVRLAVQQTQGGRLYLNRLPADGRQRNPLFQSASDGRAE